MIPKFEGVERESIKINKINRFYKLIIFSSGSAWTMGWTHCVAEFGVSRCKNMHNA